jgi:hypothetical protein
MNRSYVSRYSDGKHPSTFFRDFSIHQSDRKRLAASPSRLQQLQGINYDESMPQRERKSSSLTLDATDWIAISRKRTYAMVVQPTIYFQDPECMKSLYDHPSAALLRKK